MAFTKVVGPGIHTLAQLRTHNIHSAGIITATRFVGEIGAGTGNTSTFTNVNVTGNLTVQGDTTTLNTTLRNVELLRVASNSTTTAGIITQTGTGDILNLFDGTTEVMTVENGGDVGIGTDNPKGKLHISDTVHPLIIDVNNSSSDHGIVFTTAGSNTYKAAIRLTGGGASADKGLRFHTGGYTNSAEALRISSAGKVGIGTIVPEARLHVSDGHLASANNFDSNIVLAISKNTTTSSWAGLALNSGNAAGAFIHFGDTDDSNVGRLDYTHTDNSFKFFTNGSGSERLRIASDGTIYVNGDGTGGRIFASGGSLSLTDGNGRQTLRIDDPGSGNTHTHVFNSNGRLGVGTTNPNAQLDVYKSGTGTVVDTIITRTSGGGAFAVQCSDVAAANPVWALRTYSSEDLVLSPGGHADANEKVRIKAVSGNVGIGTINPHQPLTIARTSAGQSEFGVRFQYTNTTGPTQTSSALLVGSYGLKLKNYNSSRYFLFETGNVGIATDAPASPLHIGQSTDDSVTAGITLKNNPSIGAQRWTLYNEENVGTHYNSNDGGAGRDHIFETNGTEVLRINSSGDVGIGTDLSGVSGKFQVFGTNTVLARFGNTISSLHEAISIKNTVASYPAICVDSSHDTLDLRSMGSVQATIDSNNNSTGKYFRVMTNGEGNSGTELFRVDDSGRVLIGNYSDDIGDGTLQVYTSDRKHPAIRVNAGNSNGLTMLSDAYQADESQVNIGLMYSSAKLVLSTSVKPSDTADNTFISSQDTFNARPCALTMSHGGVLQFLNTSTNATTTTDSAVSLTERFSITKDGEMLLGTGGSDRGIAGQKFNSASGWSGTLQIEKQNPGAGNNNVPFLAITAWNGSNEQYTGGISFNRSNNNTNGTHGAVTTSQQLGNIAFNGSDGTNFIQGAEIFAIPDETFATNDGPASLVFATTPNGTSEDEPQERMRITSDGHVLFSGLTTKNDTRNAKGITIKSSSAGGGISFQNFGGNGSKNWRIRPDDLVGWGTLEFSVSPTTNSSTDWPDHADDVVLCLKPDKNVVIPNGRLGIGLNGTPSATFEVTDGGDLSHTKQGWARKRTFSAAIINNETRYYKIVNYQAGNMLVGRLEIYTARGGGFNQTKGYNEWRVSYGGHSNNIYGTSAENTSFQAGTGNSVDLVIGTDGGSTQNLYVKVPGSIYSGRAYFIFEGIYANWQYDEDTYLTSAP